MNTLHQPIVTTLNEQLEQEVESLSITVLHKMVKESYSTFRFSRQEFIEAVDDLVLDGVLEYEDRPMWFWKSMYGLKHRSEVWIRLSQEETVEIGQAEETTCNI